MTFVPRPHQIAAEQAVDTAFRAGINRPLVDICVGGGKSHLYAMNAKRAWVERGERTIIAAHRVELVQQTFDACADVGVEAGINSATLDRRDWRMPVIVAQIQSVHRSARSFGPIGLLCGDEAHLWQHSESGMFRQFHRELGYPRLIGGTGTPFRMLGGSLTDGEDAPFDKIVYRYSILDGIRDGFLVPPFSVPVDDRIDPTKLRVRQGEYTGASSDDQMIALMDNHIAQMLHYGRDRRSWLVFEASTKAAVAMAQRMNEWGIPTGLVLGSRSKADDIARQRATEQLRSGQLRALVNLDCLTVGFDVQEIDLLVCRRRTKSLGLWVQIVGRMLRTIGGNMQTSIARGKSDALLLDFADNSAEFGPLDFIRPKDTKVHLATCECCGKRNPSAARKCWACDAPMTKLCPACLGEVVKGTLDCPHCAYDMRAPEPSGDAPKGPKLLDTPSGAALIASFRPAAERQGGWVPVRRSWSGGVLDDANGQRWEFGDDRAQDARWIRSDGSAILVPNGRLSAWQISRDGSAVVVPMPAKTGADNG
jgi:DNA repair protein RadD